MGDLIKTYEKMLEEADNLVSEASSEEPEPTLIEKELVLIEQLIEIEKDAYNMKMELLEGFKTVLEEAIEEDYRENQDEDEEDEEGPVLPEPNM